MAFLRSKSKSVSVLDALANKRDDLINTQLTSKDQAAYHQQQAIESSKAADVAAKHQAAVEKAHGILLDADVSL